MKLFPWDADEDPEKLQTWCDCWHEGGLIRLGQYLLYAWIAWHVLVALIAEGVRQGMEGK